MRSIAVKPSGIIFPVLCFIFSLLSNAQSPGGVKGCELWLKGERINEIKNNNKLDTDSKRGTDLNFNYAISFSDSILQRVNKIVPGNRFTVFVVYKSNTEEQSLLSFKNKKEAIEFSTKKIMSSTKIEYAKGNPKQGIIVGYLTSIEKKGKNSLHFFTDNLDVSKQKEEAKTSLLEFIYYPRFLNSLEKQKIETYLSIKYGVSLLGDKDYVTAKGDTLWNAKTNKEFNKRVTGIGRNDLILLNQKQSGNSEKDGLYISLGDSLRNANYLNKGTIGDDAYLMWGDNNKPTVLKFDSKQNDGVARMERIWKAENKIFLDSLTTSLLIDTKEMSLIDKTADTTLLKSLPYWLLVDDSGSDDFDSFNANYIKGNEAKDGKISFQNVVWKGKNSKKFTFVKAPSLFFDYEIKTVCENADRGEVQIKIRGGLSPFAVDIYKNGKYYKSIQSSARDFNVESLSQGNYKVSITDSKKEKSEQEIIISSFEAIQCQLEPKWYLNENQEVLIKPTGISNTSIEYNWMLNGSVISKENVLKATQAGSYTLILKNADGCQKEYGFTVENQMQNIGWMLYPNPTKSGEKFTLNFNYDQPINISLKITDLNGRILKVADLGKVERASYTESLNVSGTYMVLITIGSKTESTKLIIE